MTVLSYIHRGSKNLFVRYCAAIPLFGTFVMLLYPLFNDEVADRMTIANDNNALCCGLIQFFSWIVLSINLML